MQVKWSSLMGCKLLFRYFGQEGAILQKELAEKLGVAECTIYFWKIGFRRPSRELRPTIARLTGIAESTWMTKAERVREDRLRAA